MTTISAVDLHDVTGGKFTPPSGESTLACVAHTLSMGAAAGGATRFAQWGIARKSNGYVTAAATAVGTGFGVYRFCFAPPVQKK